MKIKNVSRQPLCVQGSSGGIHLTPGEIRDVKEGELGTPQVLNLLKQGLIQVIQEPPKPVTKTVKDSAQKSGNENKSEQTKENMNG